MAFQATLCVSFGVCLSGSAQMLEFAIHMTLHVGGMLQTEFQEALAGSMHEAHQASAMTASLAKTNWINSGLRSKVTSMNTTPYPLTPARQSFSQCIC